MTTIWFRDFGRILGSRKLGQIARDQILSAINNDAPYSRVLLNFEDVELVSHSFADECFAKLAQEISLDRLMKHTTFCNVNPLIAAVIRDAIETRNELAATL